MKKTTLALAILMTSLASANYSKKELKNMSKKELISTVLHLQERFSEKEKTISKKIKRALKKELETFPSQHKTMKIKDIETCLSFSFSETKKSCFRNRVKASHAIECKSAIGTKKKQKCLRQARRIPHPNIIGTREMNEKDRKTCHNMFGIGVKEECLKNKVPTRIAKACDKAFGSDLKKLCLKNY